MRALVLEDDETRIAIFKRKLVGCHTVFVDKVEDCINLLNTEKWDYLFLDHDLGGQVFVEPGDNTGYAVAKWLEQHPENKPPIVIVHSLNENGRNAIMACIPTAINMPGAFLFMQFDETAQVLNINPSQGIIV